MSGLFELDTAWWELIIRGAMVYFVLLILVRMSGKRTVGEFTPFDLIVVVLLSESVSNALVGEEESLLGGLIVASVLIGLNWLVGFATARSQRLDRLIEGTPVLVARDGQVFEDALRRMSISVREFEAEMRSADCASREQIQLAFVEPNGHISIVTRKGG